MTSDREEHPWRWDLSAPTDGPFQKSELTTKIKPARMLSRKCRLVEYSTWRNFKKPLDERRLCQAVSMNDTATVIHLLNQGVSPSCYDRQMRTPLHLAACKGYAHMVKILLDKGADPNGKDSIGNTPLHLATCTYNLEVILLLLCAGTNVSSKDFVGRSPLQLALSKARASKENMDRDDWSANSERIARLLLSFSNSGSAGVDSQLLSHFHKLNLSDAEEKMESFVQELNSLKLQK
ncbi:ankyrin repeat domain-containing protein 54-like isoform X2 [Cimex lectularius]|nr:ankyrin repeat domain-containing protein 54-like isoform X2 [Cimex lectularius]